MKDDKYFQINDMRYFYCENFKLTLSFIFKHMRLMHVYLSG